VVRILLASAFVLNALLGIFVALLLLLIGCGPNTPAVTPPTPTVSNTSDIIDFEAPIEPVSVIVDENDPEELIRWAVGVKDPVKALQALKKAQRLVGNGNLKRAILLAEGVLYLRLGLLDAFNSTVEEALKSCPEDGDLRPAEADVVAIYRARKGEEIGPTKVSLKLGRILDQIKARREEK